MNIVWKIVELNRNTVDSFVTTAHWTATANDSNYSAYAYGTCDLIGKLTTPYEKLTEEQVLDCVWESLDKSAIEASLAAEIEKKKNFIHTEKVPWGNLEENHG